MREQFKQFLLFVTVAACLAVGARASERDPQQALAISHAALGNALPSVQLVDSDGRAFAIDTLRGKPLVVSLVYSSCHHVCPVITRSVAHAVNIGRDALGDDAFNVITVGFDWEFDTPDQMRMFAATQGVRQSGWHFLSGDEATITALTEALGFQFYRSAKGFDHLSQTTVVDRDGRIYRHVYGPSFDAPALVEPLKELVFDTPKEAGALAHWVDTFRLFCTVFDPRLGRYKFDYSILMAVFTGVLCLGAVGVFIAREWRRSHS